MRHDFFDRYSRLESPLHRVSAEAKLAVALAIVSMTVTLPVAVWFYVVAITGLAVVMMVAKIPCRYVAWRLVWVSPFVLGLAVLGRGWLVVAKSLLCVWTMILLANTTPFSELLRVLRRVRVPGLLVTTLALMYRYLFVLVDEAERMQRARACRSVERRRWHGWKMLATVVGQLFVRSTERAERIYAAMLARGWR